MRRARISQHHCKIPFAAAVQGYFQFAARPERHVLFAVGGRAAVRGAVYPVHGEVAFVLRPLPVVYIPSEGGDAQRRSGDETYVGIYFVEAEVIFAAGPHRLERSLQAVAGIALLHYGRELAHSRRLSFPGQLTAQGLHLLRDVNHLAQKEGVFPRYRHLLFAKHCPEAFFKVIVLVAAKGVDVREGAVVVGDEQSLIGYDAARAGEVQGHHGVAECGSGSIGIVYLSCRQPAAPGLHIGFESPADGVYHPHALVRRCRQAAQKERCRSGDQFPFHCLAIG